MTNPFDLSGKVALVTGGSRGLGLEMVRAFAAAGADIIIASRKLDACEAVAQEVRAMGRNALAVSAHLGRWQDADALAAMAYEHFGKVDILVNNAGMSPAVPSHEVSEELFDKVVSLNFKGPFRLASLVAHRMSEGEGGSIINISSVGSLKATAEIVPYCGAKAALNAMSEGLAREYGPKVRVNTIAAGPFLTDIARHWTDRERTTQRNALERPGQPHEIVAAALYLAGSGSSFTSAALIRVDGGM